IAKPTLPGPLEVETGEEPEYGLATGQLQSIGESTEEIHQAYPRTENQQPDQPLETPNQLALLVPMAPFDDLGKHQKYTTEEQNVIEHPGDSCTPSHCREHQPQPAPTG